MCLSAGPHWVQAQGLIVERLPSYGSRVLAGASARADKADEEYRLVVSGNYGLGPEQLKEQVVIQMPGKASKDAGVVLKAVPLVVFKRREFDASVLANKIMSNLRNAIHKLSAGEQKKVQEDYFLNQAFNVAGSAQETVYLNALENELESRWGEINGVVVTSYKLDKTSSPVKLLIQGTNLTDATAVLIGSSVRCPVLTSTYSTVIAGLPAGLLNDSIRVLTKKNGLSRLASNRHLAPGAIEPSTRKETDVNATIVANGAGFANGSQVLLDGVPLPTTFVSATQLKATIAQPRAGSYLITVKPGDFLGAKLTVVPAQPQLTSIQPDAGGSGTKVMLMGTALSVGGQVPTVRFNGVEASSTVVVNPQQIEAIVPAGAVTGLLTLTTANGTSVAAAPFTIPALSPEEVNAGRKDFTLKVTGVGFGPGTMLQFNGRSWLPSAVSSTELLVSLPAAAIAHEGSYPVTVKGGGKIMPAVLKIIK
ncbi:hypothetical protein GCM10028821_44660 [Hymenobacter jeollabukensis]